MLSMNMASRATISTIISAIARHVSFSGTVTYLYAFERIGYENVVKEDESIKAARESFR